MRGQDLQNKAKDLKNHANTLLVNAKEAEIQLEGCHFQCNFNATTTNHKITSSNNFNQTRSTFKNNTILIIWVHGFFMYTLCCVETKLSSTGVTQKCEAYKNLIQQAEGKQNELKQVMRDVLEKMNNIKRGEKLHFAQSFSHSKYRKGLVRWTLWWFLFFLDDIRVLIIQAKEGASDVNATASDAITRMQNITEELSKINISSQDSNLNDLLDGVNKTCESSQFCFPWVNLMNIIQYCLVQRYLNRKSVLFIPGFFNSEEQHWMISFTVTGLDESFPSLINKLHKVENQSWQMPGSANMSNSIQRIKDLIEETRDAANRVSDHGRRDVSPTTSRCLSSCFSPVFLDQGADLVLRWCSYWTSTS